MVLVLSESARNKLNRSFPRAYVGVVTFATRFAVGAVTEHVDFTVHAGIQILIPVAPRIVRQTLEVTTVLPVVRDRIGRGLFNQCTQPLVLSRVAAIVETVQLQRLHDRADVLLRSDAPRFIWPAHDLREDQRGQDA